MKRKSEPN